MHHPDLVLTGNGHHFLEEIQLHTLGRRVAGKIQHQHFRLGPGFLDRPFQLHKEIHPFHHGYVADIRIGNHEPIGVNRVAGIRHQHGVPGAHGRQCQMRQAFLGTNGDNGLGFRVQLHVITALVPVRHGLAQARDPPGLRITVGIAPLGGFCQLIDNMLWRGLIRIAHAEIDNILTPRSRCGLHLSNNIEDIGRQTTDSLEIGFHDSTLGGSKRRPTH